MSSSGKPTVNPGTAAPPRKRRFRTRLGAFTESCIRKLSPSRAPATPLGNHAEESLTAPTLTKPPANSPPTGGSKEPIPTPTPPAPSTNPPSIILPTKEPTTPTTAPLPINPPSTILPTKEKTTAPTASPPAGLTTNTSTLADPVLPSTSRTISPWEKAVKKLSEEDQKAFDFNDPDGLKVLDAVLKATEEKKEVCREKMWKITWKGEKIILRDVADKTVTWVKKFKTLGNMAAQGDPVHVAIPWAPVRYLLEVLIKDHEKMGEMLVGLEVITNLIGRCAIYEELYLRTDFDTAQRVEEALVVLYADMLTYLINGKHYYAENTIIRIAWGLLDTDGPAEALAAIQAKESNVFEESHLAEAKNQNTANEVLGERVNSLYALLGEFKMPIVRIEKNLETLLDGLEDSKRGKILDWISKVPYTKYHRTANDRRKEGTCGWLLKRHEFREWEMSSASNILWLRGDPGAGKTTLTSMVVETMLKNQKISRNPLAYFYCKRGESQLSDPAEILRSIARQLSFKSSGLDLQKPVVAAYETNMTGNAFNDALGIKQCLTLIISLIDLNLCTTIVIDALDECDETKRHEFFSGLREIIDTSSSLVKIFISSRNEKDIRFQFGNKPKIDIEEKDNSKDIKHYIHEKIKQCIDEGRLLDGKAGDPLKELVVSKLLGKARGMFLWVELQINELCDLEYEDDVRRMLGNFPSTLEKTYEEIYKRIQAKKGTSPEIAKKALMWVMCSYRPLSPDELATMISPQPGVTIGIDIVLQMCHNFLKIDTQLDVVRFFHLSVEEFLEQETLFTVLEANTMVAELCLSRLCSLSKLPPNDHIGEYIVLYWPTHVQRCSNQKSDNSIWHMLRAFIRSLDNPSIVYESWIQKAEDINISKSWGERYEIPLLYSSGYKMRRIKDEIPLPLWLASHFGFGEQIKDLWDEKTWDLNLKNSLKQSLIYLASEHGHKGVVEILLKKGADVNAQGGKYGNALQAAVSSGNEKLVQLLLENGADVNAQGGFYDNALQAAVSSGNEKLVQLLLENGADVNAQGHFYGNALQAAASNGNEKTVQLLLENGADVNAQGGKYGNALQAAVSSGNEKLVQLLLENGADVNAQGGKYGNALQAASSSGNEKLVQLLLENGADVNAQGHFYGNALQAAASNGNEKTVQLLLENGADVNAQGGFYGNALQAAASSGNEKTVQLLLENGAVVNAQGGKYGNALQAAASNGNEKTVQLLLENGADVNAQGGKYGNALQAAVSSGNEKLVQLLLENGADVNAQGGKYGNALQAASSSGNEKLVQLLLENGADVNAQGHFYGNALQAAASNGNEKTVQLLLENGADVNAQGGGYGNALQAAASGGNEKTVQLLLENGADVNAQGGEYGNALQAAVCIGNEKLVQLLLENGADVNAQGRFYVNALQAAISGGNEKTVQLLLENGADVNAQGGGYGNALQAAASGGDEKTVQLLLENGADVNAQGGKYGNALQAAVCIGNEKLVQLLLENGADVNAQGRFYVNALQAAISGGNEKTVQLLLENGADVNAQGGGYGNALQAAASGGNEKTVQLLLENGADVNAQGGKYGNALQAAISREKEKVVKLLLENGAEVKQPKDQSDNPPQSVTEPHQEATTDISSKQTAIQGPMDLTEAPQDNTSTDS